MMNWRPSFLKREQRLKLNIRNYINPYMPRFAFRIWFLFSFKSISFGFYLINYLIIICLQRYDIVNGVGDAEATPNEAGMEKGEDKAVEGMILMIVVPFVCSSDPFFLCSHVFMKICFLQRKVFLTFGLLQ